MKSYTRLLTLLLCLILMLETTASTAFAFVPIDISTDTYEAGTGYTSASQVNYKKSNSYVYNWGARGEDATFLSTYAVSFYTGSYTYDELSELSGATSESNVPSSSLYSALSSLMSSKHSYQTSYSATKSLFQYTDCEMNGNKISSFYSGALIGPSWDGSWNREHTWPNSKGNASGNGENDIMMLRPTSVSENSSRGNDAYGESSGYYNPNSESNGKYDLRGDVARIVLYTYVRWKCTNTGSNYNPTGIFGTQGIIQSIDILLEWIEADPVDTWELGRNDSVQSITGTRNVFVDYPEYAFILFGREIPEMTTPSGEASNGSSGGNGGGTTTPDPVDPVDPTPTPDPDPMTDKEILDAAYALNPGESLDGQFTLTGIITALDSHNNPTIVVGDYTSQEMYCYRLVDDRFEIGSTITVTGNITNYNGLIEMKNCTLVNITAPSDDPVDHPVDPVDPPVVDTDDLTESFKNIVGKLYRQKDETLYEYICSALEVYAKMSDEQKGAVEYDYDRLLEAVNKYNIEAGSANKAVSSVAPLLFGYEPIYAPAMLYAVYSLLCKKYI